MLGPGTNQGPSVVELLGVSQLQLQGVKDRTITRLLSPRPTGPLCAGHPKLR